MKIANVPNPILGTAFVLLLASLSCNSPSLDFSDELADRTATPTPLIETAQPTGSVTEPGPTSSPSASPTATPGPTMTPLAPPVDESKPLSSDGPWLVYQARASHSGSGENATLFVVNEDGSGRRMLDQGIPSFYGLQISPEGDRIAYLQRNVDDIPHLVIRFVPSGEVETEITLISQSVLDGAATAQDLKDRLLDAVGRADSIAWSPHGHYLGFVGALDGPSADLYRFDTWSNNIRRLSDEPRNVYQPSWSPDGTWIVHRVGEEIENDGIEGIAAVSFDGRNVKSLYPSNANDFLVAWLDEENFLTSYDTRLGPLGLSRADVDGSSLVVITSAPVSYPEEMMFDGLREVIAVNLRADDPRVDGTLQAGIYLISMASGDADLVLVGDWRSVEWWDGKGVFVANGEQGTVFIRRTGEVVKEMAEIADPVALSPDGAWMVSYGDTGVTVYTHIGTHIRQVVDAAVAKVIWRPDSGGFFIDAYQTNDPGHGHHLYMHDLGDWDLQLVDLDFRGADFWIGPALSTP